MKGRKNNREGHALFFGRRGLVFAAAVLLIVTGGVFLTVSRNTEAKEESWYLSIDGIEIPKEEYLLFLNDQRGMTAAYFASVYGIHLDDETMYVEYDGVTPISYAKDKALEALVLAKEEAILAEELGIIEDPSYTQVIQTLQDKNADHAVKEELGEAYYGLTDYDEFTGYQYLRAVTMTGITEEWIRRANPDEGTLYGIYEDHIELFAQGTEFVFRVCYMDGSSEELTITESTIGKEDYETQALADAFFEAEEGSVLEDRSYWGIQADIKLISKKDLGYRSPEECRSALIRIYAEEDLDQTLKRRVANAKLEINQEQYESILFTGGEQNE